MSQFIDQHPYLTLLAVALMATVLWSLWRRHSLTRCSTNDELVRDDPIPFLRDMIRLGRVARVHMRPRYVPKRFDESRSQLMTAQILADQEAVHEEAGEVVHAPAPGEPGYREPHRAISVQVGQFKVRLERDGRVRVAEIAPHGAETPFYDMPREWSELVAVLVVEIAVR